MRLCSEKFLFYSWWQRFPVGVGHPASLRAENARPAFLFPGLGQIIATLRSAAGFFTPYPVISLGIGLGILPLHP
jgi:hypothetical protein